MSNAAFREEVRDWLEDNVPPGMRNRTLHFEDAYELYSTDEAHEWRDRAAGSSAQRSAAGRPRHGRPSMAAAA